MPIRTLCAALGAALALSAPGLAQQPDDPPLGGVPNEAPSVDIPVSLRVVPGLFVVPGPDAQFCDIVQGSIGQIRLFWNTLTLDGQTFPANSVCTPLSDNMTVAANNAQHAEVYIQGLPNSVVDVTCDNAFQLVGTGAPGQNNQITVGTECPTGPITLEDDPDAFSTVRIPLTATIQVPTGPDLFSGSFTVTASYQ